MNHWLAEELTRQVCADRERELEAFRMQNQYNTLQAIGSLTTRVALKFSDWLIVTGERIQQRYEKNIPASPWVENRKFAR